MIYHKSPVLLAFKIIILELIIELAYLTFSALAYAIGQELNIEIRLLSPLVQLTLLPLQIGVLVWMLMKWSSETYEIQSEELIVRSGIANKVEKAYPYNNMQSVIVRQSVLERFVGAGTVSVFVPTLGTELYFDEVPNPKQFAESIKKSIPSAENAQFILRK